MTSDDAVHAGGDRRNRKAVTRLTLQPGLFRLRYVSNATHAYPGWAAAPPERERFYGVTVFNLIALPLIKAWLERTGLPPLASTLREAE